MTPEQAELIQRTHALLEAEPHIEAAWLSGSLGSGGGDALSDVDLLAACAQGARGAAGAAWPARFEQATRAHLAETVGYAI